MHFFLKNALLYPGCCCETRIPLPGYIPLFIFFFRIGMHLSILRLRGAREGPQYNQLPPGERIKKFFFEWMGPEGEIYTKPLRNFIFLSSPLFSLLFLIKKRQPRDEARCFWTFEKFPSAEAGSWFLRSGNSLFFFSLSLSPEREGGEREDAIPVGRAYLNHGAKGEREGVRKIFFLRWRFSLSPSVSKKSNLFFQRESWDSRPIKIPRN